VSGALLNHPRASSTPAARVTALFSWPDCRTRSRIAMVPAWATCSRRCIWVGLQLARRRTVRLSPSKMRSASVLSVVAGMAEAPVVVWW